MGLIQLDAHKTFFHYEHQVVQIYFNQTQATLHYLILIRYDSSHNLFQRHEILVIMAKSWANEPNYCLDCPKKLLALLNPY